MRKKNILYPIAPVSLCRQALCFGHRFKVSFNIHVDHYCDHQVFVPTIRADYSCRLFVPKVYNDYVGTNQLFIKKPIVQEANSTRSQ